MTFKTYVTGFSRIGENRELKRALENFWRGKISQDALEETAQTLRKKHWLTQQKAGIDLISINDFSYYDTMLDAAVLLNAVPARFKDIDDELARYFAMARGNDDVPAMEMTKWFNTNYHYLVPELNREIKFKLDAKKVTQEFQEAKALGINGKINLIGPLTFLALSKTTDDSDVFDYLPAVLDVYSELLKEVANWDKCVTVQFDEPVLVKGVDTAMAERLENSYQRLASVSENVRVAVVTYFEHASEAVRVLVETPVWGIGLDFVYGKENVDVLQDFNEKVLIAGVIDGRNIWLNEYDASLSLLTQLTDSIPAEQIYLSTSCSLLHVPYTIENEPDSMVKNWLAFGKEKLAELTFLSQVAGKKELSEDEEALLLERRNVLAEKKSDEMIHNSVIRFRMKIDLGTERSAKFEDRIQIQKKALNLPILPTTTIGSFPQTVELRKTRSSYRQNKISEAEYQAQMKAYIDECVAFQEEAGLDVFVHGEPERNDMVEYFGELMKGFHFTQNGWVQSYGSRCVKPPVIFGDISHPEAMTVEWIRYAQSKTDKPMKAMLTGPITILNWSFVRTDLPRSEVALQLALVLKDEVSDLQKAGIKIIQVDEAAFKEGYPLRAEKVVDYEDWAVKNFKRAVSTANPETQIHTHMCYSEFNEIIDVIEELDADVITIETARSGNELLKIFRDHNYQNEIGPGVYDIHSPRVPSMAELKAEINSRLEVLPVSQLWVNPDCGLKTRRWEEVRPALQNMVAAVKEIRAEI